MTEHKHMTTEEVDAYVLEQEKKLDAALNEYRQSKERIIESTKRIREILEVPENMEKLNRLFLDRDGRVLSSAAEVKDELNSRKEIERLWEENDKRLDQK